jgi:hypothetical protein
MVDASPGALVAMFEGMATGNLGDIVVKTLVYLLFMLLFAVVAGLTYVFLFFRKKVTIFHVTGSGGKTDQLTISKKSWDYVRENRDGSWTWLMRGFKREEAFPDKSVYPGNTVIAFKLGTHIFPGRADLSSLTDFMVQPVPYDMRKKMELEYQQIDIDLQKQDWWSQGGKQMLMALGFSLIVIGFAAFVVWLAFAKTNTIVPQLQSLTDAMKSFGDIPGK